MSTTQQQRPPGARQRRAPWRAGRSSLSETRFAIILVLPAMLLFGVIILYPLLNSMWIGLLDKSLVTLDEEFVGLDNLRQAIDDEFFPVLRNTLVFTVGATALPFVIGYAGALMLNLGVRGQAVLRGLFLLPWVLPGVVVSFLWLWIFNANYGVLNGALRVAGLLESNVAWLSTSTGAMLGAIIAKTWHSFPWMMVMLLAGLQTVPRDLHEAAAVDGANAWRRFFHITVPHMRGFIFVVLLLETIWNFQHFELIYVLTGGGPAGATTTFSVAVYETAFHGFDLGRAGALGILWMIILTILIWVFVRVGGERDQQ